MSRQRVYYEGKAIEILIEKHQVETVHFHIIEKKVRILLSMPRKYRVHKILMVIMIEI